MAKFGIGQGMKRREDQRFLTGAGRYTDDIGVPNAAVAVFVRSPYPHADVRSIESDTPAAMPGVLAVLTAADVVADGLGDMPCQALIPGRDGKPAVATPYPILARDRVRHVGDPVAMVIAETVAAATDAAEAVEIDYDALPSVGDIETASAPGAPSVWNDALDNVCVDWETGDASAVEHAFAGAAHVVSARLVNNRIIVNSIEPRGAVCVYDAETEHYTLHASTQGSHGVRSVLCGDILKIPNDKMRVITPDVGGGFGMKIFPYREHALVAWASKRVSRPVKWIAERTESFVSDTQGRDHISDARPALDANGKFLALAVDTKAELGAYLSLYGPAIPTVAGCGMLAGLYTTPAIHVRVRCYFSNTLPLDAYRGAGRPEAAYVVERMADIAAKSLGLTPDEIRRRNFISASAIPYTTPLGETYDSGDFAAHLDKALAIADWQGVEQRKKTSQAAVSCAVRAVLLCGGLWRRRAGVVGSSGRDRRDDHRSNRHQIHRTGARDRLQPNGHRSFRRRQRDREGPSGGYSRHRERCWNRRITPTGGRLRTVDRDQDGHRERQAVVCAHPGSGRGGYRGL